MWCTSCGIFFLEEVVGQGPYTAGELETIIHRCQIEHWGGLIEVDKFVGEVPKASEPTRLMLLAVLKSINHAHKSLSECYRKVLIQEITLSLQSHFEDHFPRIPYSLQTNLESHGIPEEKGKFNLLKAPDFPGVPPSEDSNLTVPLTEEELNYLLS